MAQKPLLLHFTEQDGLPSNVVYDIFQDSKGFIWLGTSQGVCIFDGHQFKTYTIKDGLPDNDVFATKEDDYGRCWLVCYKSQPCYVYKGRVYNAQNDMLCRQIAAAGIAYKTFFKDKQGRNCLLGKRLCIVTQHSVIFPFPDLNFRYGKIDYFDAHAGAYYQDGPDIFFFCNNRSRHIFRCPERRMLASGYVHEHYLQTTQEGSQYALYDLHLRDSVMLEQHRILTGRFCYNLYALSDTEVLLMTDKGVQAYNPQNHSLRSSGLIQETIAVNRMLADNEGNYWFATVNDGVYLKMNERASIYDESSGLKNNDVLFTAVTDTGTIVAAYSDGTFSILDKGKRSDYAIPQHGVQNRIMYISPLDGSRVLAGADMGAFIGDLRTGSFRSLISGAQKDAMARNGHFNMASSGLACRLDAATEKIQTLWQVRTTAVTEDDSGRVWLGTLDGLYCYTADKLHHFTADTVLSAAHITSLYVAAGRLIIATHKDGLYTWNGTRLQHIGIQEGLESNTCKKVIGDNAGNIWLCTDAGVNKIVFTGNNAFSVYRYSRSDGLVYRRVNHIALYGNSIYLATSKGILVLDKNPSALVLAPRVYITAARTKDTTITYPDALQLQYNNHVLELSFTGIAFADGSDLPYKYVLGGAGNDTVFTRSGTVNLGAVKAGDYRFLVWAKAGNSPWSSVPAAFSFHVEPPFWLKPWFIAIAACIMLATIWLLYRRQLRLLKLAEEERLDRQKRVAQLEIEALRAQINPHFMFNVLNSIQHFYSRNDERRANYYMTSFAQLVRKSLTYSKDHWIPLAEELAMIGTYIELEQMCFDNRFCFEIGVPPDMGTAHIKFPAMLIQPYVENGINHGIGHLEGRKGLLELRFEQVQGRLCCTIADNGIGIETLVSNKPSGHQSMGMKISGQRIEYLNQLYQTDIRLVIKDRRRLIPAAAGTVIEISLPLYHI